MKVVRMTAKGGSLRNNKAKIKLFRSVLCIAVFDLMEAAEEKEGMKIVKIRQYCKIFKNLEEG